MHKDIENMYEKKNGKKMNSGEVKIKLAIDDQPRRKHLVCDPKPKPKRVPRPPTLVPRKVPLNVCQGTPQLRGSSHIPTCDFCIGNLLWL